MIAYRCDYNDGDLIDGRYRVESKLGTGSFGNVYKVRDVDNRIYALKLLRLWDVPAEIHEELVNRFNMEYKVSRTNSDYFVHSYESSQINGNPYFTMEYCPGGNLAQLGEKALENLTKIAHDILRGLHDLHSSGLVHRDLKPENVMIKENGIAALTDFGIVGDKKGRMTSKNWRGRPKQVFGTYLYMSPEQADREGGGVTYLPTADIFSFGVMMYEIITQGSFPFGELNKQEDLLPYQTNAKKGIWNYKLLRTSSIGVQWEKVIRKCLMADYRLRYHSVKEIISDIPGMNWSIGANSGDVKRIVITLGADMGKEFILSDLLQNGKRMIRLGRDSENDVVLKESLTSYVSRYHFTLETDKDGISWYIRDGQWHMDQRQWMPSTNGTYLGPTMLGTERTKLNVGDVITVGDIKILIETI